MENLDNVDQETLKYLKEDYEDLKKDSNDNTNGEQKKTKCKP